MKTRIEFDDRVPTVVWTVLGEPAIPGLQHATSDFTIHLPYVQAVGLLSSRVLTLDNAAEPTVVAPPLWVIPGVAAVVTRGETLTMVQRFETSVKDITLEDGHRHTFTIPAHWWRVDRQREGGQMVNTWLYIIHADDTISAWPFANVHPDGHVCWGYNTLNAHITPQECDGIFWRSPFNRDLRVQPFSQASMTAITTGLSGWPSTAMFNTSEMISYARRAAAGVTNGQTPPTPQTEEEREDQDVQPNDDGDDEA